MIDPDQCNINFVEGDATRPIGSGVKIIPHCCNNIGGFGSGFVLALTKRWPEPRRAYLKMYRDNKEGFHKLLGATQFVSVEKDILVANIIGQDGVRGPGNPKPIVYEALETGLTAVGNMALEMSEIPGSIVSIHAPRLGCKLAGGSWAVVEEIIRGTIPSSIPVTIYDFPGGTFNP